jgi:hypothetical protein
VLIDHLDQFALKRRPILKLQGSLKYEVNVFRNYEEGIKINPQRAIEYA